MTRYSRMDWLEQGLHVIANQGVDALTIELMCQRLGLTKGSFYHHFKNREHYLESILAFWEERFTEGFITYSQVATTPAARLARLLEKVVASHDTSEVAIRAWAHIDPLAQVVQARVDHRRILYLTEQLVALGRDAEQAQTVAHLLYTTLIGAQEVIPPLTSVQLSQMYRLIEASVFGLPDAKGKQP